MNVYRQQYPESEQNKFSQALKDSLLPDQQSYQIEFLPSHNHYSNNKPEPKRNINLRYENHHREIASFANINQEVAIEEINIEYPLEDLS